MKESINMKGNGLWIRKMVMENILGQMNQFGIKVVGFRTKEWEQV